MLTICDQNEKTFHLILVEKIYTYTSWSQEILTFENENRRESRNYFYVLF